MSKKGLNIQFNRMTGRIDKELENQLIEEELGHENELDLQINEWKPNLPRTTGFIIPDPKKIPRFEKEKINSKPLDAPLTPPPKYDYIQNREIISVNMDKMIGRHDNITSNYESEFVDELILGEVDKGKRIEYAKEKDQNIANALDITSKHHVVKNTVNISKQTGRNDDEYGIEVFNSNKMEFYLDPDMNDNIYQQNARVKGVDWSKQKGRNDNDDEIRKLNIEELEDAHQLLILNPSKEYSSKSKKVQSGAPWKTQVTDRFTYESPDSDNEELVIENADHGNTFKL